MSGQCSQLSTVRWVGTTTFRALGKKSCLPETAGCDGCPLGSTVALTCSCISFSVPAVAREAVIVLVQRRFGIFGRLRCMLCLVLVPHLTGLLAVLCLSPPVFMLLLPLVARYTWSGQGVWSLGNLHKGSTLNKPRPSAQAASGPSLEHQGVHEALKRLSPEGPVEPGRVQMCHS